MFSAGVSLTISSNASRVISSFRVALTLEYHAEISTKARLNSQTRVYIYIYFSSGTNFLNYDDKQQQSENPTFSILQTVYYARTQHISCKFNYLKISHIVKNMRYRKFHVHFLIKSQRSPMHCILKWLWRGGAVSRWTKMWFASFALTTDFSSPAFLFNVERPASFALFLFAAKRETRSYPAPHSRLKGFGNKQRWVSKLGVGRNLYQNPRGGKLIDLALAENRYGGEWPMD